MAGDREPVGPGWDNDDAQSYRRPRRPVEVRRRAPWKQALWTTGRILFITALVAVVAGMSFLTYRFATRGAVFRLASLENVEVANSQNVPTDVVRERFAEDVGRSILTVPLGARRQSLEELTWVEAATIQRLFPNRLRAYIRERTPVAFLRQGQSLWLVDRFGVLLPVPENASYSFPVLAGLPEALSPAERQARVQLYLDFVADLDHDGKNYSGQFSEIDLSDPEDVRASVTQSDGAVWLHFGRGGYQEKFEAFLQHRSLWQEKGEQVRSVDLRYRGQIVLNPDPPAETRSR